MSSENTGDRFYPSTIVMPVIVTIGVNIFTINVLPFVQIDWWLWVLYYLSSLVGGVVAATIANMLRLYVSPDAVFTTGGFCGLLWTKVFWAVGPHFVASLIVPVCWFLFSFNKMV